MKKQADFLKGKVDLETERTASTQDKNFTDYNENTVALTSPATLCVAVTCTTRHKGREVTWARALSAAPWLSRPTYSISTPGSKAC